MGFTIAWAKDSWCGPCYALEDPVEEKLAFLSCLTLAVRDSNDALVPQRRAEEVTCLLPVGGVRIIAGGPHVVNYTTPHEFTRLVRQVVQRLD